MQFDLLAIIQFEICVYCFCFYSDISHISYVLYLIIFFIGHNARFLSRNAFSLVVEKSEIAHIFFASYSPKS